MRHSLDADFFINALQRFIVRRALPIKIFCDNGGNCVKGEQELHKAFLHDSQTTLQSYATSRFVEWSFNPPLSPHGSA